MRKALFITSQEPLLEEKFKAIDTAFEHVEHRMEFLKKQADTLGEEFNKQKDTIWEEITAFCLARGSLPEDFTKDKYHFHYDKEASVLHLCDGTDHDKPRGGGGGIPAPIRALMEQFGGTVVEVKL